MSQAEELLNGLEEHIETYSVEPDTEPHIVINPDKTVTIPDSLKRILVQYEHNIETVTFDCPRYWDGHDLSAMEMRIVFQRSDGHKESHPVENLRVDETDSTMIHFDWTISRNTTLAGGSVAITVCAKIANTDGVANREWHTIPNRDIYVNEGMDCSGDEIVEQNPDIIEAILVRLDIVEQGGVSDERIAQALSDYLMENPVQAGATAEQAAQIEANKQAIEDLQNNSNSGGTVTDEQIASAVAAYMGRYVPTTVDVELLATNWNTEKEGKYYQNFDIATVNTNCKISVGVDDEAIERMQDKVLAFSAKCEENGVATVTATGDKPTLDFTIQLTFQEVVRL